MKKKSSAKRKIAVFDVDGTIFRSSLFIELTEALIHRRIFKPSIRKTYARQYTEWLNRQGSYEDYIWAVVRAYDRNIKGVSSSDFMRTAKEVVAAHQNRVYRYTRDLIKELKKKKYYLVAISQSPKIILDPFCKKLGFDKVYGRILEVGPKGKFTGQVMYLDLILDKGAILRRAVARENLTLRDSIAVGDTEGDVQMLEIADHPICFNPNRKLYELARKKGWEVVVERKDVIYTLK